MEVLSKFLDSQAFAAIIGALIGIIPTAWYAKKRKQQEDRVTYFGWLNGLSAETEHIKKVIQEITGILRAGGICTKRINHDFLEKSRLVIFAYDEDTHFLETLTNAYRDVVHTNDMIDRHERLAASNQTEGATTFVANVLASMEGVGNSINALQALLQNKLNRSHAEQKMNDQKKMGGWIRLWIVLSVIYLIFIGIFEALTLPKSENTSHSQAFYNQLPPDMKKKILGSENSEKYRNDKSELLKEASRRSLITEVEMPNSHIIVFRSDLPKEEMEAISREYWKVVEHDVAIKRRKHIGMAFAWWLIPVVGLFGLGWSAGWVYKGFKK